MSSYPRKQTSKVSAYCLGFAVSLCRPAIYPPQNPSPPFFFFFNHTAAPEIYTLSLHDPLPISLTPLRLTSAPWPAESCSGDESGRAPYRSEEHTSELQPRQYLVCRLLLEK